MMRSCSTLPVTSTGNHAWLRPWPLWSNELTHAVPCAPPRPVWGMPVAVLARRVSVAVPFKRVPSSRAPRPSHTCISKAEPTQPYFGSFIVLSCKCEPGCKRNGKRGLGSSRRLRAHPCDAHSHVASVERVPGTMPCRIVSRPSPTFLWHCL